MSYSADHKSIICNDVAHDTCVLAKNGNNFIVHFLINKGSKLLFSTRDLMVFISLWHIISYSCHLNVAIKYNIYVCICVRVYVCLW
jgi:hypothetical protein